MPAARHWSFVAALLVLTACAAGAAVVNINDNWLDHVADQQIQTVTTHFRNIAENDHARAVHDDLMADAAAERLRRSVAAAEAASSSAVAALQIAAAAAMQVQATESRLEALAQRLTTTAATTPTEAPEAFYQRSRLRRRYNRTFHPYSDKRNWLSANMACRSKGQWLAHIDSAEASEEAMAAIDEHDLTNMRLWIGAHDNFAEDKFVWEFSGSPVEWSNWATGEPNNWGAGENSVVIFPFEDGKWNDVNSESMHGYLCESRF